MPKRKLEFEKKGGKQKENTLPIVLVTLLAYFKSFVFNSN